MAAYYNEIDPFAAAWLRELINAGHIAPGDVDTRSIVDAQPSDLRGYTQCHFFAGIGVWSYALRRAGWPDDRPVWTGSCPCQPFSAAGKGGGFDDERHLWPAFYHLIGQCGPSVVFGEQVASKDADPWIDLVQADMEALGYAFGAVPFPSAGIGAPHIRDRTYWLANAEGIGSRPGLRDTRSTGRGQPIVGDCSSVLGLADATQEGSGSRGPLNGHSGHSLDVASGPRDPGPTNGLWRDADWLFCRDGKWRPVEPCTFPLAHGAPARVGRLRGYGNAINAVAAEIFITAYLEKDVVEIDAERFRLTGAFA